MREHVSYLILGLALGVPTAGITAEGTDIPRPEIVAAGILVHDRGPTSDHNEGGVDPNIELQFKPLQGSLWRAIGSPRPHVGFTPNFTGDTSALYGGATYEFGISSRLFATGGLGLALHNGPLHNDDRIACEVNSDCGFGSRVLFHYALELGMRIDQKRALTLYYDHMSHQGLIGGENEGIDHIGLRYQFRY